MPSQRPENFRLNTSHNLYRGLVFAGLGAYHGPGTTYRDSSIDYAYPIRGNNGTLTGYTGAGDLPKDRWQYIPQLGRWGLGFDGTNDYVDVPGIPIFGTGNFTVAAWIACTVNIGDNDVFMGRGTTGAGEWMFGGTSTNDIRFYSAGGILLTVNTKDIVVGVFSHVCVRRIGAVATLYQDGVLTATDSSSTADLNATTNLTIGTGAARYFPGTVVDPLIFASALSAPEIRRLADPSNVMLDGLIAGTAKRNRISMYKGQTSKGIKYISIGGSAYKVCFKNVGGTINELGIED